MTRTFRQRADQRSDVIVTVFVAFVAQRLAVRLRKGVKTAEFSDGEASGC
jgi:hypothetical protein